MAQALEAQNGKWETLKHSLSSDELLNIKASRYLESWYALKGQFPFFECFCSSLAKVVSGKNLVKSINLLCKWRKLYSGEASLVNLSLQGIYCQTIPDVA